MSTRPPERTWLQRNTKWIVLGAIGVGLMLLGGFIVAILLLVSTAVRSSDVFATSLARAQTDPRVVELLGAPVEAGFLLSGSMEVKDSEGSADIVIPLSGARAEASLTVVAKKRSGQWHYVEMRVTPETGDALAIDLLNDEERRVRRGNLK